MNDSTTDQLSVGEVRSVKFSPSILTLRNATTAASGEHQPHATAPAWMGQTR